MIWWRVIPSAPTPGTHKEQVTLIIWSPCHFLIRSSSGVTKVVCVKQP
jgi:hypothetical protein